MADLTQRLLSASCLENSRQEAGGAAFTDRQGSIWCGKVCNIPVAEMDARKES